MALIVERFVVGPLTNNLYLLIDDVAGAGVVVDPSIGSQIALARVQALRQAGLTFSAIWNTHGHFDHIYDNAIWRETLNVPLLLHRDDAFWVERVRDQALWFNLAPPAAAEPDRWLNGEETLQVGSHAARVLPVPGHSPGSVAFVFETAKICVSGDVVFRGSVGRTDLPGCSRPQLDQSLAKLMAWPDAMQLLPGHYEPTTVGQEKRTNPFCQELPILNEETP